MGERLPYKQRVTGSSPVSSIEPLAQLVEQLTFNQWVDSSSLSRLRELLVLNGGSSRFFADLAQLVEHLTFNQRVGSSSLPRLIGPEKTQAGVAELADALDLGSSVFGRVGSSPTTRTMPI